MSRTGTGALYVCLWVHLHPNRAILGCCRPNASRGRRDIGGVIPAPGTGPIEYLYCLHPYRPSHPDLLSEPSSTPVPSCSAPTSYLNLPLTLHPSPHVKPYSPPNLTVHPFFDQPPLPLTPSVNTHNHLRKNPPHSMLYSPTRSLILAHPRPRSLPVSIVISV
jgi:hypothetical protein